MRFILLVLIFIMSAEGAAQVRPPTRGMQKNSLLEKGPSREPGQAAHIQGVFAAVERGFLARDATLFSDHFGKQVSLTISGSDGGFVSASQAVSILENYFSSHKPTQFAFTRWNDSTANPYASGHMTLSHRGSVRSVQIYFSLSLQEEKWVISRLSIY